MQVKQILEKKGSKVWSVTAAQTIRDALRVLVENKIGAVLVFDDKDRVSGILSERDIMRECHRHPKRWADSKVQDVMTQVVIMVTSEAENTYVMELMTEKRIRHLPVMDGDELKGIVSIGDIVKARLEDSEHEIQHMKDYLSS